MSPHVLLIDNYDSFTYNLVQGLAVFGARVTVRRNDAIALAEAVAMDPTHLMISPGPGRPEQAGASLQLIETLAGELPTLGVCLGMQAMALVFGGRVVEARSLMHGKASDVHHDSRTLFRGLSSPMRAGRYHSLAVERESLPEELEISAQTEEGEIMALRHRTLALEGVQFHPESVLTPDGGILLSNFLSMRSRRREEAQA